QRGDGFDASTKADATDPWLELATGALRPSAWLGLDRVTPSSLAIVAGLIAAIFVAATWYAVARAAAGLRPRGRVIAGCALLGLGSLVVGAKLWLIAGYGSSVPFLDEWLHPMFTFLPYSWGDLSWHDLMRPHNEHRLFLSRILALALLGA